LGDPHWSELKRRRMNTIDGITVIGLIAAVLTTISFLPQAIKTIKSRQTKDLSLFMYSILTTGVFLWFVYGILLMNAPLMLANGITLLFTTTILVMKIKYK